MNDFCREVFLVVSYSSADLRQNSLSSSQKTDQPSHPDLPFVMTVAHHFSPHPSPPLKLESIRCILSLTNLIPRSPDYLEVATAMGDAPMLQDSRKAETLLPAGAHRARYCMIVDPEDAFRSKARAALEAQGHQVDGFRRSPDILQALTKRLPNLIIADLSLPNREAEALYRTIRADEKASHIPFLFLSRGGHPLDISRGIRLEESVLLKKPFSRRQFETFVSPLLKRLDLIEFFGSSRQFQGALTELDLYDLMGLLQRYALTGKLTFAPEGAQIAELDFLRGRMIRARQGPLSGNDVLMEITLWHAAVYTFEPTTQEGRGIPRDINDETWNEISDALHFVDRGRLNPFPFSTSRSVRAPELLLDAAAPEGARVVLGHAANADDEPTELIEVAFPESSLQGLEPVVYGPPPARWDESDPDLEILTSEVLPDLSDAIELDLTPLPTCFEPAGRPGTGASRADVLAYLVRRRDPSTDGRSALEFMTELRNRLGCELQLCTSAGMIVATTLEDASLKNQLSSWAALVHDLSSGHGAPILGGHLEHLGAEFERGFLVVNRIGPEALLVCRAGREARLGNLLVECQRLAARLSRAVEGRAAREFAARLMDGTLEVSASLSGPGRPLPPPAHGVDLEIDAVLRRLHAEIHELEASAVMDAEGLLLGAVLPEKLDRSAFVTLATSARLLGTVGSPDVSPGALRQVTLEGPSGFLLVVPLTPETIVAARGSSQARLGLVLLKLKQAARRLLPLIVG